MDIEKNKAIVRRYYDEVWNQFNLDVIEDLFTSDYRVPKCATMEKARRRGLTTLCG